LTFKEKGAIMTMYHSGDVLVSTGIVRTYDASGRQRLPKNATVKYNCKQYKQ